MCVEHTHTHQHKCKHKQTSAERKNECCFLCRFVSLHFIYPNLSACVCWMCLNSHIYLSIYLSVYLFICAAVKTTAKVKHNRQHSHTRKETQYGNAEFVEEKAISYDRYLFCVLSNHIRSVCVCLRVCTPCMHGVRKDVYSTYCDLLSWLYLSWIRPSMSTSVFSILLFRVPASNTALLRSTLHTLSRIMCHMCETLGPGSTFQEQKELASEWENVYSFVCFSLHFTRIFCSFCCFSHFHCACLPACVCVYELPLQILNECKFFIPLGIYRWCKQQQQKITHKHTYTIGAHKRKLLCIYEQQEHINTYVRLRCSFVCWFSHIFICCLTFSFIIIFFPCCLFSFRN